MFLDEKIFQIHFSPLIAVSDNSYILTGKHLQYINYTEFILIEHWFDKKIW